MATTTITRAGGSGQIQPAPQQLQAPQQPQAQPAAHGGGGGGGGGRGGGGGGPAPAAAGAAPQQPVAAQAGTNGTLKGTMPMIFTGERGTVELFLQTFNYFRNANHRNNVMRNAF